MKTSIFQYTDFREYLKTWLQEKQLSSKAFSLRHFARKAGISSPNYFQRVIQTGVKLSDSMVEKFISGIGLQGKEAEYFRALIRFNQTEDAASKIEHLRALEKLSKRSEIRVLQSRNLLKAWYYPVIWELATCKDFELTPTNVLQALGQNISKREAKEAIEFLEQSGYLTRQAGTNRFSQPPVRIESPDEILNPFVQAMHRKFSELSAHQVSLPLTEREYQGVTIALSPEKLKLAKQIIKKTTDELLKVLSQDSEADRVYRINLQVFPVTAALEKNSSTHPHPLEGSPI